MTTVYCGATAINFLPANDHLLYAPAQVALVDRKNLLAKFKDKAFPYIDINELPEQIYRVLRKLGTPLLSELVRRKKVVVENAKPDTQLTYQISLLEAPLKRVARKFFADDDISERKAFEKISNLVSFSIFACDRIEVEYFIQNGSGWEIVGYRDNSEKSLVDELENSLFVRRVNGALDNVQLALEITALLFPQNAASIIVERLLEKKAGEIDAYLDQHGYPKLMMAESTTESGETLVDTDAWKIPETKNPLEEEEEREKLSADKESDDDNHPEFDIDEPDDGGDYGESPTSLKTADEIEQPTETVLPEPEIEEHESLAPVPPFTGRIRPSTPVLPNDFSELRRRFGLSLSSSEQDNAENILNLDRIDADTEWEKDEDKDQGRVTSTRFTLTFSNRYEGFLPLHQPAKQMLRDLPPHLICETDFLQWKFILYVDYERQIIYNQRELPSFFEAHNIPAGGIIYLELVHGNHCRMFWKSVQSQINNVTCLEILDDGTLDEYEISSADFPCELSEYVFRSEKRLEDINALFEQAIGKKGIFQTICEVFDEAGRDLSYDEIFRGVTKIRMVARASIDYQLNQRPCFVKLENGRWRFEPDRGAKIGDKRDEEAKEEFPKSHQSVIEKPEEGKDTPTSSTPDITVRSTRSILLSEIRREWALLSELFKNGDEKQHDELLRVINQLIKFANKWQASLQALISLDELDSTLVGFWWQVAQDPRNKKTIQLLEKRLQELFDIETIDRVIPQLHQLLTSTGNESRQIFHKLLSNVAKHAFEQERFSEALQIYQLLEKSDAGDFQIEIHQIHQQTEVQACLDQLRQEQEFDYRLVILQDTWTKYPNYPSLRRAVHAEVYQSAIGRGSLIQESLEKGDSGKAYQVYEEWSSLIWPLLEGWRQHDITSAAVWEVVRKTFVTLHNQACKSEEFNCFDLALRIANTTPIEIQRHIPAPDYVAVLIEVAQNLETHEETHKAAAMMEYGIFLLAQSHRGLERYLEYKVNEYTGRLFEQLELIRRADYYLHKASKFASPEQKKHLGHRRYSLIERIKSSSVGDPDQEDRIWKARLEGLAGKKEFTVWVDPLVYKSFIDQIKLW